ncbi:MAG: hypothetical protein ACRDM7_21715, partial [Thermoleophilaceae bacterium]
MRDAPAIAARTRGLGATAWIVLLTFAAAIAFPAASEGRTRDADRDGLSNRLEVRKLHTSPRKTDTDRDGLSDGYEVRSSRTDPLRRDTDRDGLTDGVEVRRFKTNPRRADTDRDGVKDGLELLVGGDPLEPQDTRGLVIPEPDPALDLPEDPAPDLPADPVPDPPAPPVPAPPDLLPPDTTIDSGPSGTVSSASARFTFSSSETGSTFQCRLDNGAWAACTSPKTYAGLANGAHTFEVRATDAAGNLDLQPAARSWTVNVQTADTTPPNTTIDSGPSGTVATSSASFSFSSTETGSTFQCRLDTGAWGACTSPRAYSGLANGSHTFDVRATDGAGNVDASPATRTWTVDVQP